MKQCAQRSDVLDDFQAKVYPLKLAYSILLQVPSPGLMDSP